MPRWFRKDTLVGLGIDHLPGRKYDSLLYINGDTEYVIGTVKNRELFILSLGHLLEWEIERSEE